MKILLVFSWEKNYPLFLNVDSDRKYKCIFMFPHNDTARKRLNRLANNNTLVYSALNKKVKVKGQKWDAYMTHYSDVIMGTMASQIASLTIVYSTVYSVADQRKHQSFASLAFVRGIHRSPVNSPHKWPVTRKMFPIDDVIMFST